MENIYETDRLFLRVLDKSYADTVLDYYLRNREFLKEWEALKDAGFYTREYHEKLLNNELIGINNGFFYKLWIFKKENEDKDKNIDNDRTIGAISFNNIIRGAFLSCHLGYKLDKDEINNGYITEAVKKGIEIIFNDLKLHRIEANIMPKNKRSLRVVEKLGFYNEGLAYKYLKINGSWEDHVHMVLLNDSV
jgi:ribosomal-protein-alanine N-acetyltransferase